MRTLYCGDLNLLYIGKKVTLCGWISCYRNLGNLIFVDIRDREGSIQVLFDKKNKETFKKAKKLRNEYCVQLTGFVKLKNKGKTSKREIEILAIDLIILNYSKSLTIDLQKNISEEQRLKFRYLDLRRPIMIHNLKTRSKIFNFVHNFMTDEKFIHVETPILAKSTLEGACDYLVPSRINKGKFYALPQSPQLFKQLLMISGLDRYYQIAKCFRDEDLRSDRQPEFTQIDIEASFITSIEIRKIIEKFICTLWKKIINIDLGKFFHITYSEAINRFGSDKPDLRCQIELIDISNLFQINKIIELIFPMENNKKYSVIALCIPIKDDLKKNKIYEYKEYAKKYGSKELFWIENNNKREKFNDSTNNIFSLEMIKNIFFTTKSSLNDIIFIGIGNKKKVIYSFGKLRKKIIFDLQLFKKNTWSPVWVTDFPMFKKDKYGKIFSVHHPFTSPKKIDSNTLLTNPISEISDSYDLIINGHEIGSGSVRIHKKEMQENIFNILGIKKEKQYEKFGFLLDALDYGAPPHAGIALGLDRIIMLLCNVSNIRDVIAFPKTTSASDLMIGTPSIEDIEVLENLSISLIKNK